MGLSYYGFAFFIFLLLCAFALLCKFLFARTKNHLQTLEEKEKKLLALYSTLEDMMDEFNDSSLAANTELNRHIAEIRQLAAGLRGASSRPHATVPGTADVLGGSTEPPALPRQELKPGQQAEPQFTPLTIKPEAAKNGDDRPGRILALHKQGMDRVHIAKELAVTLSEVDLVLGIAAQKK